LLRCAKQVGPAEILEIEPRSGLKNSPVARVVEAVGEVDLPEVAVGTSDLDRRRFGSCHLFNENALHLSKLGRHRALQAREIREADGARLRRGEDKRQEEACPPHFGPPGGSAFPVPRRSLV